jgi:hypothetical protein
MNRTLLRYIPILLLVLVGFALVIVRDSASQQEAPPHDFSETAMSEAEWRRYGRHEAELNGLVGEPTREDLAVMTYGAYAIMAGEQPNPVLMPRDGLVVVYQVLGDVPVLNGFSLAAGRTDIAGFIFVYNAATRSSFRGTALADGKPGVLDFSHIPVDNGTVPSIDLTSVPTTVPMPSEAMPLPTLILPESTADFIPLPAAPLSHLTRNLDEMKSSIMGKRQGSDDGAKNN